MEVRRLYNEKLGYILKNKNQNMSSFLENLKNAVDSGEFNSDAAMKIVEVTKLSENIDPNDAQISLERKLNENNHVQPVSETEAFKLNMEYERKMHEIKTIDLINKQIATLIDIEDMVMLSIEDMLGFCDELDNKFSKEFEEENPLYGELSQKIEGIKSKFNQFNINNKTE